MVNGLDIGVHDSLAAYAVSVVTRLRIAPGATRKESEIILDVAMMKQIIKHVKQ